MEQSGHCFFGTWRFDIFDEDIIGGADWRIFYFEIMLGKLLGLSELAQQFPDLLQVHESGLSLDGPKNQATFKNKDELVLPKETPYPLGEPEWDKKVEEDVVWNMGNADYDWCKTNEQCKSQVCVKVDNEVNNRMCRPVKGFKTSEQCYFDDNKTFSFNISQN